MLFCGSMTLEALVSLYQFREGSLFTSWGFSGRPLPLFRFNNPVNQPPSFWFGHHLKRFYFAFLKGQAAAVAAALLVKPELRVDENWNGNRTKPAGLQTFKRFCLFNRFLLSWDRFDKEYLRESWKLENGLNISTYPSLSHSRAKYHTNKNNYIHNHYIFLIL